MNNEEIDKLIEEVLGFAVNDTSEYNDEDLRVVFVRGFNKGWEDAERVHGLRA